MHLALSVKIVLQATDMTCGILYNAERVVLDRGAEES